MRNAIVVSCVPFALAGCLSMERVEFKIGVSEPLIEREDLEELYDDHGFTYPLEFEEGQHASSTELMINRNELQQKLLTRATEVCHQFKVKLSSKLKDDETRLGVGVQLANVMGATASNELVSKGFAATGAGLSSLGNRYSKTYEVESLNIALSGIERARRRVFLQIEKKMKTGLVEYPVGRAVNDAYRYHTVCTLMDGLIEAANAVKSSPSP